MSDYEDTPRIEAPEKVLRIDGSDKDPTAAEIEAAGVETLLLSWGGKDWTVPASLDNADITVIEAFEAGHGIRVLKGLFGGQWRKLERHVRKANGGKFSLTTANEINKILARAYGMESEGE